MLRYVLKELVRNPRRTLTSLVGVILGTALFSGVLFFMDGSTATMTSRAIAPLPLDMQREVSAPLGQELCLEETVATTGKLAAGEIVTFTLLITNPGDNPQHEVVVKEEPPPSLTYVAGSTKRDGTNVPDCEGEPPLSHGSARLGLNLGTLHPGESIILTYQARADTALIASQLQLNAMVSSQEHPVPLPANRLDPLSLQELSARIRQISGVVAADPLSFVDIPLGSLAANGNSIQEPVRVFAFGPSYRNYHQNIRIDAGGFDSEGILLSVEAARTLGIASGDTVRLTLPGASVPTTLPVSGLVDLSDAKALFWSRKTSKFEDFLYVPNSVVVSHDMFQRIIIPAYRAISATPGSDIMSFPVSEVDIHIDRSRLNADPGHALAQTQAIAELIQHIGPAEGNLIDNISNTLEVARDDARAGKRMFMFIGLPGGLLAAFLAAYAGSVLSATQRREHAILRVRGAHRSHLLRMLLYRTLLFSALGAVAGMVLGFASILMILGPSDLLAASPAALAVSASIATGIAIVITSIGLYIPGRQGLQWEIGEERWELERNHNPLWRRLWLDVAAVVVGTVGGVAALSVGAFDTQATSVSIGQSIVLPYYLLVAPMVVWIGGSLLCVRAVEAIAGHLPISRHPCYGPVLRGTLFRSLRRRSRALAIAAAGLALIVALGTNLVIFTATYLQAKAADARFAVGSDLRLTPNVLTSHPYEPSTADALEVIGVEHVSPVVFQLENAVLIGRFDQNLQDLAAISPSTFAQVAPLSDAFFLDTSAADAMASLHNRPYGLLVNATTADDLSIEPGDDVKILLARGTDHQTLAPFYVVGRFERFPGFPEGVDLVIDINAYQEMTGLQRTDFFLAKVKDHSPSGLHQAIAAIQEAPVTNYPFGIESTQTVLLKDQSSLIALNINGLSALDTVYTMLMTAAVIAIFVFALMLQRRPEYSRLHARGLPLVKLGVLVFGEVFGMVAAGGLGGLVIGTGMAYLFVHVLRPLFILNPIVTLGSPVLVLIICVAPVMALIAAMVTTLILKTRMAEMLRET